MFIFKSLLQIALLTNFVFTLIIDWQQFFREFFEGVKFNKFHFNSFKSYFNIRALLILILFIILKIAVQLIVAYPNINLRTIFSSLYSKNFLN